MGPLHHRRQFQALDVAGGDARMSTGFLLNAFAKVDLFDQCPEAVKRARHAMQRHKSFGYVSQATMQSFEWRFRYSGIFMVWCSGYLVRPELVRFLQRAKAQLIEPEKRMSRSSLPESFIYVLDNVLCPGEVSLMHKGQQVRAEAELEEIFREAGLMVFSRSKRQPMPAKFRDVVVWALY